MSATATDPVTERLEDQISWYDRKSGSNQRAYKRIKIVEIFAAALIPFVGAFNNDFHYIAYVTGALGVIITILEGLLHLNQYQQNWAAYRSTCEALRHEKYCFLAKAADYTTAADPRALLAERIESLVSQEHAKWSATQQQTSGQQNGAK
ncbi:MAG: hypothetical protein QOC81_3061 [Thermoanaerobaculia bacterium]|jgi:hypothetical protein|nr:hypothetical protein [Thermoanaerobaculia bacterium]